MDPAAESKFLVAANAGRLKELAGVVEKAAPWTAHALEEATNAWLASAGLQIKDVAQAARVALTGKTASPGLFDVIAVLGKERAVRRLLEGAAAGEKRG
jgi:glutamyl-tRNA synthetase